jgi:hypothetical protein
MTKTQVHIVFKECRTSPSGNEFVGVFFDRVSAEAFIVGRGYGRFFIETYDQPEAKAAHEVYTN